MIAIMIIGTTLTACKMPEQAPKEPVDAACLAKVETILTCKTQEAKGLDDATSRLITKAVDANRKQANISTEKCNKILSQYATDPCNR